MTDFILGITVRDLYCIHAALVFCCIASMALAACAALAVFRFKFGMVPVLLASSLAGGVYVLVGGNA